MDRVRFEGCNEEMAFYRTTSVLELDSLLGGGIEVGLMHLFYSFAHLRDNLLETEISKEERWKL